MEGELVEQAFAGRGEAKQNDAAVGAATNPADQEARFEAIEQFDEAVMLQLEAFGEEADRGFARGRSALQAARPGRPASSRKPGCSATSTKRSFTMRARNGPLGARNGLSWAGSGRR